MMTHNRKLTLSTVSLGILIILRFLFKDAQSELPIFLNILIGGLLCFILLNFIFKSTTSSGSWVNQKKYTIPYLVVALLLISGIQAVDKLEDSTLNEDTWLKEIIGISIAVMLFFFIYSWIFNQWKKIQDLKHSKSKAELSLLKNQINPHFFFNTLNNLYSLIKKDPDVAQDYVLKLSDLMRFTIYEGEKDLVLLKDEVAYLTNFIELQTARYHRTIDIQFDKSIENPEVKIAPLIFIMLLENAFKHGVEKVIQDSFIDINLIENKDHIEFEVKNNFDPKDVNSKKGIGLKNLEERLTLLYPNNHKLETKTANNIFVARIILNK